MTRPLFVHGLGHFHPETVIDNAFLEALDIGTTDEWILERVGIRERRSILPLDYIRSTRNADVRAADEAVLCSPVQMALRAAALALARAGLAASDVGLVVAGGCTPGMNIPSDANRIAEALGIGVPAFDLNAACASFGSQLHWLRLAAEGLPEFVLVVNTEATTRVVDYSDRSSAVLWGDAATAAVVSSVHPARLSVANSGIGGNSQQAGAVTIPRFGHFTQQGNVVQRFAIKTMHGCLQRAQDRQSARAGSFHFVGHQANRRALESVARSAALPEPQHWHNVTDFGNSGAAGAPSVLSQHWADLASGDAISVAVVGSGLSWAWLDLEVA